MDYDIPAVREALAAAVRANDWSESGYRIAATGTWPSAPMLPAFAVMDIEASDHQTLDGAADLRLTGRLAVGTVDAEAGQKVLDRYLSRGTPDSVLDALERAEGVGDVTCTGFDGYRLFEWAGRSYFGAEIEIEVLT